MRKTLALMACGGAIVAGAVFAGTVIGDDGSTPLTERLQPGAFDRSGGEAELAGSFERSAVTSSGGKKILILKGASKSRTIAAGGSDSINLLCPKRTSALSGGFETSQPG